MSETPTNIFRPWGLKQELAIFSEKPIVVFACGIQAGKTTAGAIKTKLAMCRYSDQEDNFLITAPTYKILQQSTLPAFLFRMDGLGVYSKADAAFKMYNGGTCYMRTQTDPDSIVGITNVRFIWGDEAGLYSLYFWENMLARAAFKRAQVLLTTSPYALNWLYREIIKPKQKNPNAREDVELILARSDENPYFPKDIYEQRRKTMDPRRFKTLFGGEWTRFEGLVYDCFDEEENQVDSFSLPYGTKFYAGVDWGYTNPTAISVRAVTPEGMHYQVSEVYERGKTIHELIEIAQRKKAIFGIERFFCDPENPAYIEEFNRAGLTAVSANNDIRLGIDAHYELIKSRRFKMFRGLNKYTLDELESYRYPDDEETKGPNRDVRERVPVARENHLMDANRYLSVHLYRPLMLEPQLVKETLDERKESRDDRWRRITSPIKTTLTEDWS